MTFCYIFFTEMLISYKKWISYANEIPFKIDKMTVQLKPKPNYSGMNSYRSIFYTYRLLFFDSLILTDINLSIIIRNPDKNTWGISFFDTCRICWVSLCTNIMLSRHHYLITLNSSHDKVNGWSIIFLF